MKFTWTLLFALILASCNDSSSFDSKKGKSPENQSTKANESKPETLSTETKDPESKSYQLQITVLSFLEGGREACDVTNKLFQFSMEDRDQKLVLCKNSKVEVSAVSDSGIVTFYVSDVHTGVDFPKAGYSENKFIELGEERKSLRYSAQVPNAFTYIMAEDFTGVDPELLSRWNELNQKNSGLKAQVISAEQNGDVASEEILLEISETESEMAELKEEMEKTRQS